MRKPMMSGHCATPSTANPDESHARCRGGNTANPAKEFQPCPCLCHFQKLEQFDCECGGVLVETTWPNDDPTDIDDEGNPYPVYLHVKVDNEGAVLVVFGQECE